RGGAPGSPAVQWPDRRAPRDPPPVPGHPPSQCAGRAAGPAAAAPAAPPATIHEAIFDGRTTAGWRTEHDPTSLTAVEAAPLVNTADLRFRYGLAGGASVGQVVALVYDTPQGGAASDRLSFSIRPEHPTRASVQL